MLKLDKRGIAPAIVIVILLASAGAGVATPVVVDAIDVDPDSPFYGLERLGEKIRMVSDDDQMKERWGEYQRMVNRGKGLIYKEILAEFREKMQSLPPDNVGAKMEVVQWMQKQMPGVGLAKIKLAEDFAQSVMSLVKEPETIQALENEIYTLKELEENFRNSAPEMRENLLARLQLMVEQLKDIVRQLKIQLPKSLSQYFEIDNMLLDVDVDIDVHVNIRKWWPRPENAEMVFKEKLGEVEELFAEIQAKLEGLPENILGRQAAETQHQLGGSALDDAYEEADAGNYARAIFSLHKAWVHLQNAERILEHAEEWEQRFSHQWNEWRKGWENIKQSLIENRIGSKIPKNLENLKQARELWKEQLETMREQWKERWEEQWEKQFKQQVEERGENQLGNHWSDVWRRQLEQQFGAHFGSEKRD